MYLLQGCPIITPQFASLSLLVNCNGAQKSQTSSNSNSNNGNHNYPKLLGESMLVASPIATIDQRCTMSNLAELHQYLAPKKKDKNNLPKKNNLCVNNSGVQVFRARHGVGLHYIAIFDRQTVQNCSALLLSNSSSYSNQSSQQQQQKQIQHSSPKRPNKNNSKSTSNNMNINTSSDTNTNSTTNSGATIYSNNINAVVLCVGLSGTSYLYSSSSLLHVLPKRLHESIPILNNIGKKSSLVPGGTHTESRRVVRSLLASLLFEDEQMNTLSSSSGVVASLLNESLLSSKYEFEKNQVMALAETDMNLKPILNLNYSKIKQQQKIQKKKKSNNNQLSDSNEQGKEETESYYYKVDTPTLPGFDDFPAPSISSSIKTIPSLGRNKRSGGSSSSLSSGPFLLGGGSAMKDHTTDQHQRPKQILRRLPAPSTSDSTPSKRNYLLQKKKQMLNSERNSTLTTPSSPSKPSRRSIPQQHQQRQQKLSQASNSTQQQQGGELSDTELISPVRTKDLYQGEPIKQAKSSLVSSPQPSVSKHRRTRSHGTFASSPVKSNNDITPEWTANFDVFNKTIPLTTTTTTKVDPLIHPMATNNNHNTVQQPQSSATSLHSLSGMEASTTMTEPPSSSSNSITPKVKLPPPPPFTSSSRLQRDQQKLVLNVALNEDLMCTYQQGKMFSSVIEGHVQFQLSYATHHAKPYSSSSSPSQQSSSLHPFTFLIKDSSRHLRAIQECMSPEFFKNCSQEINKEQDHGADYKYQVQLPVSDYNNTNTITNKKRDNYTSFLKYKCSHELRPVPIRVQTRIRTHESYCRIALQISSNPANENDLSDLTIIMPCVSPRIKGETLQTSPEGGVWHPQKKSVVWRVSELGRGEKFQLQAQFELFPDSSSTLSVNSGTGELSSSAEKLTFPVLVRCQCMHAQLSDVSFSVYSSSTSSSPRQTTDLSMRLTKRFRLSHREKP